MSRCGGRDPFGPAVIAFPGGPAAFFDEAVVGPAGQGECGDVGGPVVVGPALDVVGLTPVARGGAAWSGAAAVEGMKAARHQGSEWRAHSRATRFGGCVNMR